MNKLYVYCSGGDNKKLLKLSDGSYELKNKKIKLVLSNDPNSNYQYKDKIFVVDDIKDKWRDDSYYLLILKQFENPSYEKFNIDDSELEFLDSRTDFYWIKDNTIDIQNREINELNILKQQVKVKKFKYEKNFYKIINNTLSDLEDEREKFTNKGNYTIYGIQDYELRNINVFLNEYISVNKNLIDDIFQPINDEYDLMINLYDNLLDITKGNPFYSKEYIFNQKQIIEEKINIQKEIENMKFDFLEDGTLHENLLIRDIFNIYYKNLNNIVLQQIKNIEERVKEEQEKLKKQEEEEKEELNKIDIILTKEKTLFFDFKNLPLNAIEIERIDITAKKRHNIILEYEYYDDDGNKIVSEPFYTNANYIKNIDSYIKDLPYQDDGGNGGLRWGQYNEKDIWEYFWFEWNIKFYAKNIPQYNYNIIDKYNKINKNNLDYLILSCSGLQYLKRTFNKYDLEQGEIQIFNFDTIYDLNTIFYVEKIYNKNIPEDTYDIEIKPVRNIKFKSSFIDYGDNKSYWTLIEKPDIISKPEDDFHIDCELPDETIITDGDNAQSRWIPSVLLKTPKLATDGSIIRYPIRWAYTSLSERKVKIEPFMFKDDVIKFALQNSNGYQIRLWSKINNNIQGTKDNYYINEHFETMPLAEINKSSFGIYTSGYSEINNNTKPKKDLWFSTKFDPIRLNIINFPSPNIIDFTISRSNKRLTIFWSHNVKNQLNGLVFYNFYKFNTKNNDWDKVLYDKKSQQYVDNYVKSFTNYIYKVEGYTYFYNDTIYNGIVKKIDKKYKYDILFDNDKILYGLGKNDIGRIISEDPLKADSIPYDKFVFRIGDRVKRLFKDEDKHVEGIIININNDFRYDIIESKSKKTENIHFHKII